MKRLLLAVAFVMAFSSNGYAQIYEPNARYFYFDSFSEARSKNVDGSGIKLLYLQRQSNEGSDLAKSVLKAPTLVFRILSKRISTEGYKMGWKCDTVSRVVTVAKENSPNWTTIFSCDNFGNHFKLSPLYALNTVTVFPCKANPDNFEGSCFEGE